MANNKKPRKKYNPTKHLPHDVELEMNAKGKLIPKLRVVRPMTMAIPADDARTLKLIPHQELDNLRNGNANEQAFHTIICRLNFGVMLHQRAELTGTVEEDMRRGMDAMISVRERAGRVGKWGINGDEYKAVGHALELVDHMQEITTRREQRDALRAVFDANERMLKEKQ